MQLGNVPINKASLAGHNLHSLQRV